MRRESPKYSRENRKRVPKRISGAPNRANWRPRPQLRGRIELRSRRAGRIRREVGEFGGEALVGMQQWSLEFGGAASGGGGERAEKGKRWDGMCEWGDDRWGPLARWPSGNRATRSCMPRTSGYTTIGTVQRKKWSGTMASLADFIKGFECR